MIAVDWMLNRQWRRYFHGDRVAATPGKIGSGDDLGKNWEDRAAFCLVCGAPMTTRWVFGADRRSCTVCDFIHFRPTSSAGVAVVVDGRRILMVRRGIEPYRGCWGFPGGFQDHGESLRETAVRETLEEASLPIRICSVVDVVLTRDDPRKLVNAVVFLAEPVLEPGQTVAASIKAADDATDVAFFSLDDLPEKIAFASNRMILQQLRDRFPNGDIL